MEETLSQTNKILDVLFHIEELTQSVIDTSSITFSHNYLHSVNVIEQTKELNDYQNYCEFPSLLPFPNCKEMLEKTFKENYSKSMTLLDS